MSADDEMTKQFDRRNHRTDSVSPRMIAVMGAPRSGTTVLKRYLASNPGCSNTPFPEHLTDIAGFKGDGIAVWKKTKWIDPAVLPGVVRTLGDSAHYVLIARYPTNAYLSLLELNAFRKTTTHEWLPATSFSEYLKWWSEAHRTAAEVLPKDRRSIVSYEAFVLSPAAIRTRILAAVGLLGSDGEYYDNGQPLEKTLEDEKCIGQSHVHAHSVQRAGFTPEASRAYDGVFGEGAADRLAARLKSDTELEPIVVHRD